MTSHATQGRIDPIKDFKGACVDVPTSTPAGRGQILYRVIISRSIYTRVKNRANVCHCSE